MEARALQAASLIFANSEGSRSQAHLSEIKKFAYVGAELYALRENSSGVRGLSSSGHGLNEQTEKGLSREEGS